MSSMTVSAGFGSRAARAPRTASVAAPAAAGMRLTRRGRLLVSGLALLVLVAAAVLLSGGATARAGTDRAAASTAAERVTVRPGETLWQIAERVAPDTDPRETIAEILDLNGLQTAEVRAGTALTLP